MIPCDPLLPPGSRLRKLHMTTCVFPSLVVAKFQPLKENCFQPNRDVISLNVTTSHLMCDFSVLSIHSQVSEVSLAFNRTVIGIVPRESGSAFQCTLEALAICIRQKVFREADKSLGQRNNGWAVLPIHHQSLNLLPPHSPVSIKCVLIN